MIIRFVICVILMAACAAAQDNAKSDTKESRSVVLLEKELRGLAAKVNAGNIPSKQLRVRILKELKNGRFISKGCILRAVSASEVGDILQSKKNATKVSYANTVRFIEGILEVIYERPLLSAELHQMAAMMTVRRRDTRLKHAQEAHRLSVDLKASVDLQWLKDIVALGGIYNATRQSAKAEKVFLRVGNYMYLGTDREARVELLQMQIEAARGLITSRKGNLKALKGTSFYPWVEVKVKPMLDEAIKEAEAMKKK